MKKTSTIIALMAFGVACATAGEPAPAPSGKGPAPVPPVDPCAGPISYNNVELMYANTDGYGAFDDDGDGVILNVEYSPWNNIYLTATASYTDIDSGEVWNLTGGIGGYIALTPNIHLAADAGLWYVDSEFDIPIVNPLPGGPFVDTVSDDDTGWYIRPHFRAKWSCFEAHLGAVYLDLDDAEDWNWFVQLYYQVAPGWDITAGYNEWDDAEGETWSVGARYKF